MTFEELDEKQRSLSDFKYEICYGRKTFFRGHQKQKSGIEGVRAKSRVRSSGWVVQKIAFISFAHYI